MFHTDPVPVVRKTSVLVNVVIDLAGGNDDGAPLSPKVGASVPVSIITGIVVVHVVDLPMVTVTVREAPAFEGPDTVIECEGPAVEFVHMPLPITELLDSTMPDETEVPGAEGRGKTVIMTVLSASLAVMTVVSMTSDPEEEKAVWLVPLTEVSTKEELAPLPDGRVMAVRFEGTGNRGVLDFVILDVMVGKPEVPLEAVEFEGTGKSGVLVRLLLIDDVVGRINEDQEPVKLVPIVVVDVRTLDPERLVTDCQRVVEFGNGNRGVLVFVFALGEVVGSPDRVPVPVKLTLVEGRDKLVTGMVIPPGRLINVTLRVPGRGVTETPVPVPDVRPKIVVFEGIGGKLVWIVKLGLVPVPTDGMRVMLEGTGKGGVMMPEGLPVGTPLPVLE